MKLNEPKLSPLFYLNVLIFQLKDPGTFIRLLVYLAIGKMLFDINVLLIYPFGTFMALRAFDAWVRIKGYVKTIASLAAMGGKDVGNGMWLLGDKKSEDDEKK